MQQPFDVAVIGLGAMGSAAAFHLQRSGLSVLGLEQFDRIHSRGSSHGESRLIRKIYFEHPDYVPLLQRAYELWDELAVATNQQLFVRNGVVIFCPEKGSHVLDGMRTSAATYAMDLEVLTDRDAASRFPSFVLPDGFVAAFERDAGLLKVEDCVRAHLNSAERLGARLLFNSGTAALEPHPEGFHIKCSKETFLARKVALTCGAWTNLIHHDALPIQAHQASQHWFEASADFRLSKGAPCFAYDMPDGFFYGFPAISSLGAKIARHAPGIPLNNPSEQLANVPLSDQLVVETFARKYIEGVDAPPLLSTNCMYTMTPDGHFILSQPEEGLVVAAGFSGHGFKFATVIGEAIADMLTKGTTRVPVGFLDVTRFDR